ncbi:hypothetical protein GmHk_15G045031 [Glycine max]|nr:hypothetical protein GmHk_15G045031 [Glycine max]
MSICYHESFQQKISSKPQGQQHIRKRQTIDTSTSDSSNQIIIIPHNNRALQNSKVHKTHSVASIKQNFPGRKIQDTYRTYKSSLI